MGADANSVLTIPRSELFCHCFGNIALTVLADVLGNAVFRLGHCEDGTAHLKNLILTCFAGAALVFGPSAGQNELDALIGFRNVAAGDEHRRRAIHPQSVGQFVFFRRLCGKGADRKPFVAGLVSRLKFACADRDRFAKRYHMLLLPDTDKPAGSRRLSMHSLYVIYFSILILPCESTRR